MNTRCYLVLVLKVPLSLTDLPLTLNSATVLQDFLWSFLQPKPNKMKLNHFSILTELCVRCQSDIDNGPLENMTWYKVPVSFGANPTNPQWHLTNFDYLKPDDDENWLLPLSGCHGTLELLKVLTNTNFHTTFHWQKSTVHLCRLLLSEQRQKNIGSVTARH